MKLHNDAVGEWEMKFGVKIWQCKGQNLTSLLTFHSAAPAAVLSVNLLNLSVSLCPSVFYML